jgi:hypothetical protein
LKKRLEGLRKEVGDGTMLVMMKVGEGRVKHGAINLDLIMDSLPISRGDLLFIALGEEHQTVLNKYHH